MIYLLGMAARVVVGTSLVMILAVSAVTTMVHAMTTQAVDIVLAGAAAGRRRGRRAIWRDAGDPAQARPAAPGAGRHHPARRAAHGARPRLAARRDLLDRISVKRALPPAAGLGAAAARRRPSRVLVPDVSAPGRSRSATASPARNCCCSARSSIPAAACPSKPADVDRRPEGPGRADPGPREAEDRRHLDERRFQPLPLGAELLRRRLVARRSRSWSMSAPRRSTSSGLQNLQLSPGGGALPEKERRFEAGLLDLRQRAGPLCRESPGRRDQRRRALPRAHLHPQPGAGRHLHRRDLPGRRRQGASPPRPATSRSARSGFERCVALAARRHGFLYGLAAVLLSLGLGWAAAMAFRRRF